MQKRKCLDYSLKKDILILQLIFFTFFFISCKEETKTPGQEEAAYSEAKDQSIQQYNIDVKKDALKNRFPCDTIALREYILNNYPSGSYLMEFDRTYTYNVPKAAVLYYKADQSYVFAIIAKSRSNERLVEVKNITGFESSFINLDSTRLGTAFFYITLFACNGDNFEKIWEREIPIHGGFSRMSMKNWKPKNIPYIETYFEDGIIVGHRDYNFFMLRGIKSFPHLLETYEGLRRKRTMANVNNDLYPDYYEFHFYDLSKRLYQADSVAFIWDVKDSLYVNTRNRRQTREY